MCLSLDPNYVRIIFFIVVYLFSKIFSLFFKQNPNFSKLIVADISPSTSPSHASIKTYLDKMISIDMNSLDGSSIFAARKQVDAKLCEVPALNMVILNWNWFNYQILVSENFLWVRQSLIWPINNSKLTAPKRDRINHRAIVRLTDPREVVTNR